MFLGYYGGEWSIFATQVLPVEKNIIIQGYFMWKIQSFYRKEVKSRFAVYTVFVYLKLLFVFKIAKTIHQRKLNSSDFSQTVLKRVGISIIMSITLCVKSHLYDNWIATKQGLNELIADFQENLINFKPYFLWKKIQC